ncbi:PD-(D/E)XK nuclease family protein [Halioxenophilus sp. WMMB6]|uniref:PD-(D/E)XK nuclease family protein n=1 Tax=Halioxenophilus sp. WMMB6 TaxID=3073815 RepID=UPI00295EF055|nr:PD-(D/E)XK nuclease family protein [Halioxenophilus sp. WMMB6]
MPKLFNIEPLLGYLRNGETIITANSRQSAKIRSAYTQAIATQQSVVLAPKLGSLNGWLEQRWSELQSHNDEVAKLIAVGSVTRRLMWQEIIDTDLDGLPLVGSEQLYPIADSALKSLLLWQQSPKTLADNSETNAIFQRWFERFLRNLEQREWILAEQKQQRLLQAFTDGRLPKAEQVLLFGFDDIPPLTEALLQASAETVSYLQPAEVSGAQCQRLSFPNKQQEIVAAAQWARSQLEAAPNKSVAIIAPNLGQIRDEVEQVFIEEFEPHYLNTTQDRYTLPFNFSTGVPLGSTPIVQDATDLLRLLQGRIAIDTCNALLQSPYWLVDDHPEQAQALLMALYKAPQAQISSAQFRHYCAQTEALNIGNPWLSIDQQLRHGAAKRSTSEWLDFILDCLQILGWPGRRRLDSSEFQQVTQFQGLLEQMVAGDLLQQAMPLADTIGLITQLAQTTPFQAQTPESPIQILGALEGAALNFDYCWVLGCDNVSWPPPPNPNPLLPFELQSRLAMPNATAAKQLAYAQSLTQRLKTSSDWVIFSSAEMDGESEMSPSGLITDIPTSDWTTILPPVTTPVDSQAEPLQTKWEATGQLLQAQGQWQWVDCEQAPAISPGANQVGGVSVLQWQAALPFNAFCRFRLGLQPLPTIENYLTASTRGQITHLVLANIWRELKSQTALLALSEPALTVLIEEQLENVVTSFQSFVPTLTPEIKRLEISRQLQFLTFWFALEKSREDFTVEAIEEEYEVKIANMTFKLRLDRLDEINQQYLLVDYKTGNSQSINEWLPGRIAAPQLPLYTLNNPSAINGIAFAAVNSRNQNLVGVGDFKSLPAGMKTSDQFAKTSWPELLQAWQSDLESLAEEFKSGATHIHNYHPSVTQYQKDYLPLNRLHEQSELYRVWLAGKNHE